MNTTSNRTTPPFAITMGDASGVGPEIVLRRAADGAITDGSVIVYGDAAILRHGAAVLGLAIFNGAWSLTTLLLSRSLAPSLVGVGLLSANVLLPAAVSVVLASAGSSQTMKSTPPCA